MLMEVKNNFKYIKNAMICNLKSVLEYKSSFILQATFMFINNFFFLIFWNVVFGISGNQTNGIEMQNILYLWSISTIAYGISGFLFGGIENISRNIITGAMDSYLTQPKNVFMNIATSKCDFSAFGDLTYGVVIGTIAANNISTYFQILLYSILGSMIIISTMTIIRSLAVYIGDVEEMAERYEHTFLINFSVYPEAIFGKITKILIYTIVPAGYMVHLPIKLLKNFDIINFLILIVAVIIYIIISIVIFKKALSNYESGNSMALKD